MKYRALIGVGALCALHSFAVAADAGHLAPYVKKLNAAEALDVTYSVTEADGTGSEFHVILAKPDKALIVTPSRTCYADGTNITTFNRSKRTYFVQDQSEEALKGLLTNGQYALWRAFFDPTAFDDVESTKDEGARELQGEEMQVVSAQMDRRGVKKYVLYISQQDGLVRQAELITTRGEETSTSTLTVASISTKRPTDGVFAFDAPANAKLLTGIDMRAEIIDGMVSYTKKTETNGWLTFKPVTTESGEMADQYRALVLHEFAKYPTEFIKLTKLQQIVLVEDLAVNGQHRSAVPDATAKILYYDITFLERDVYVRKVMHHEYYHMIEEEFNGSYYFKDPEWAALNEADFAYGTGGVNAYGQGDVSSYIHPLKGFLNWYSTYGLEEDKAVIWSVLFVPEKWKEVKPFAEGDSILRAKIDYMRKFGASKCAAMDDEYWKEVSGEGGK